MIARSRKNTESEMGRAIKQNHPWRGQFKQGRGTIYADNSQKHSAKHFENQEQVSRQDRPATEQSRAANGKRQAVNDNVSKERQQLSADGPAGGGQRGEYRAENT